MIKKIIQDELKLRMPSAECTPEEISSLKTTGFDRFMRSIISRILRRPCAINAVKDLIDTYNKHTGLCFGLSASQIGYRKRIIIIKKGDGYLVMVNPEYVSKSGTYKSLIEGCLSFPGMRTKKRRHKRIKIIFYDPIKNEYVKYFNLKNMESRVTQHEIDHCNGILI